VEIFFGQAGPLSSIFWTLLDEKINQARNSKKAVMLPTLEKNKTLYKTNTEKLNVFSNILTSTFNEQGNASDFDSKFQNKVNEWFMKHKFETYDFNQFTSGEIYKKIYKTKVNSA